MKCFYLFNEYSRSKGKQRLDVRDNIEEELMMCCGEVSNREVY